MKLLILISIVYVNKKGQFKNSMESYTFFFMRRIYTFDFKVCLGLLNKLNSYACLSLIPLPFLYSYYLIVYTLKIFLCIFCNSFLIWKKIKNDIKKLLGAVFLHIATCLWRCDFDRPGFVLGRLTRNSTLGRIDQWLPVYF